MHSKVPKTLPGPQGLSIPLHEAKEDRVSPLLFFCSCRRIPLASPLLGGRAGRRIRRRGLGFAVRAGLRWVRSLRSLTGLLGWRISWLRRRAAGAGLRGLSARLLFGYLLTVHRRGWLLLGRCDSGTTGA